MERIGVLINKLQELYRQQASPDQILHVTQMLQTELFLVKQQQNQGERKKISVMMPAAVTVSSNTEIFNNYSEQVPNNIPHPQPAVKPQVSQEPLHRPEVVVEQVAVPLPEAEPVAQEQESVVQRQFNVLEEVPTLAHQAQVRELNDTMAGKELSLNDKLNLQHGELGNKLKDVPIKDIKKAISLNDKFIYIRELFRGDEVMYERSLKTINQFSIYPEAEFWIQRELKLKLAWPEDNPLVKQFDQLVKRRFL